MADKKITQLTAYTTPIDADVAPIVDITTGVTKKITWANIKATLKTYFDTIYDFGAMLFALSAKTTPVDADVVGISDSAASNVGKKVTWANIKATLKTYFDTQYPAETTTTIGSLISGASSKATPIDADTLALSDSAASNVLKKLTWANLKATLKTYFDTLYMAAGSSSGAPSGTVYMWPTTSAPTGHLLCDGTAVSRTTYADLFSAIGTTFGAGDGSTTFNLPNFKGRSPIGYNAAETEFDSMGETGGAKTHTLTLSEIPSHDHNIPNGSNLRGSGSSTAAGSSANAWSNYTWNAQGGGQAHNNLHPYMAINFIIKT